MHSSYALSSDDFAVERGGKPVKRLADLWPGGYQPGDRLGVVLAQPMDAVGLLEPDLRHDHAVLRPAARARTAPATSSATADTYLFGVGCEPGDFNQLDVWPLHKFVTILQPTAEAVLETVNDRRITLLAIPETGARCRGEVVLSTWNAYLAHVDASSPTRRAPAGRATRDVALVGNKVVESYVEQAIFSTPGIDAGYQARLRRLRRNLDREPSSSRSRSTGRCPSAAAARALLGVTQVLPPGHQELTRRATPTIILPVEVPMPPARRRRPPLLTPPPPRRSVVDAAGALGRRTRTGSCTPPFDAIQRRHGRRRSREWEGWDWISDFGDPIAEHHAVREAVGIWDESPLRSGYFVGQDALAAADRLLHQRHGRPRGRARRATARSATSRARCSATASSSAATTPSGCSS